MRRTLLSLFLCWAVVAQPPAAPPKAGDIPTFSTSANLVIVTVFAKDKDGKTKRDLKKEDFVVLENGKPQPISVFEFQNIAEPLAGRAIAEVEGPAPKLKTRAEAAAEAEGPVAPKPEAEPKPEPEGRERFRDKRLLVLFFDWSSLEQEDQIRAVDAAEKYVLTQKSPSDLMSIVSFNATRKTEQEFTSDGDRLIATLKRFRPGLMTGMAGAVDSDQDTSDEAAFSADQTEFNLFNTDRKLGALEDLAHSLEALPEKKAIIYFSSGMSKNGLDNESQLRATTNAAVRANVSFYPIDVRGLVAMAPGGNASVAGPKGNALFTGRGQRQAMGKISDAQDTLFTLASDTGGKALFDSNDLTKGIQQAQEDLRSYYILGYYSTDDRKDGLYRKVTVKLAATVQAKIDYRAGYYAEKEFKAFSAYDRERQLQDALLLGDPVTNLPLALEVNYFRMDKDKYFVPVAVKIPGSAVPVAKKGATETAKFDFIGQVRNEKGAIAANVRDEIKIELKENHTGQLASRSLVYDTGFTLSPGKYKIKMLVRENSAGKMGTFESSFVIPDLGAEKDTLHTSSVVWSNQRQAVAEAVGLADKKLKKQALHPLVRGGQKLIPSVTRVFREGQNLIVYAEVYDAATPDDPEHPQVTANVSFFKGRQKALDSRTVNMTTFLPSRGKTVPILLEIPLKGLSPGTYTAQLNLIDQSGARFAFERARLVILKL